MSGRVAALDGEVDALGERLAALETRPGAPPLAAAMTPTPLGTALPVALGLLGVGGIAFGLGRRRS